MKVTNHYTPPHQVVLIAQIFLTSSPSFAIGYCSWQVPNMVSSVRPELMNVNSV